MPVIIASLDLTLYIHQTPRFLHAYLVDFEHLIDNGAALVIFNHVKCFGFRVERILPGLLFGGLLPALMLHVRVIQVVLCEKALLDRELSHHLHSLLHRLLTLDLRRH